MINILLLLIVFFIGTGCSNKITEVENTSSAIVFFMLIASVLYLKITPKMQQWKFTKKIINHFINKFSLILILFMTSIGSLSFISYGQIGKFLALNLFISSAFLYKLKINYRAKSENQKISEFRYFTITLSSMIAQLFLLFGGLEKIFN
jgi:TRAP-type C4-dicarboxylate transport system permease large subunit